MRRLVSLGLAVFLAACGSQPFINDPYPAVAVEAAVVNDVLRDWFTCDECISGELRRVRELGNNAVPALDSAQRGEGPFSTTVIQPTSMASEAALGIEATCTRANTRILARGLDPAETIDQCEARYLKNLARRYRYRAIDALLAIRTKAACEVIGMQLCLQIPPFPPADIRPGSGRSTRIYYDP